MGEDVGSVTEGAFRQLGRAWSRIVWSVLLLAVLLWDVFAFISLPPVDSVHAFFAGLATGMIVCGFLITVVRERFLTPRPTSVKLG